MGTSKAARMPQKKRLRGAEEGQRPETSTLREVTLERSFKWKKSVENQEGGSQKSSRKRSGMQESELYSMGNKELPNGNDKVGFTFQDFSLDNFSFYN